MPAIRANLVAGHNNKKHVHGATLAAIVFVDAKSMGQAESRASLELADLGWVRIEIEHFKEMIDSDHVEILKTQRWMHCGTREKQASVLSYFHSHN